MRKLCMIILTEGALEIARKTNALTSTQSITIVADQLVTHLMLTSFLISEG
jgi:hypothetical protein